MFLLPSVLVGFSLVNLSATFFLKLDFLCMFNLKLTAQDLFTARTVSDSF